MTYTMWDSIDPSLLKSASCDALAGYVGGNWPTYATIKNFGKPALSIAVFASQNAQCLDVERGDASNTDAPAWLDRQRLRGVTQPVLYTSASNVAALLTAIGPRRALIWSAHYTGTPHICSPTGCGYPQADATQWTDKGPAGQTVDQSVLSAKFYAAIGGTVPTTKASKDVSVLVVATGRPWAVVDGFTKRAVPPGVTAATYTALGLNAVPVTIPVDQYDLIPSDADRTQVAALQSQVAALTGSLTVDAVSKAVVAALPAGIDATQIQAAVAAALAGVYNVALTKAP